MFSIGAVVGGCFFGVCWRWWFFVGSGEIVVEKKLWGLLVYLLAWSFLFVCVSPCSLSFGERERKEDESIKES